MRKILFGLLFGILLASQALAQPIGVGDVYSNDFTVVGASSLSSALNESIADPSDYIRFVGSESEQATVNMFCTTEYESISQFAIMVLARSEDIGGYISLDLSSDGNPVASMYLSGISSTLTSDFQYYTKLLTPAQNAILLSEPFALSFNVTAGNYYDSTKAVDVAWIQIIHMLP